MTCRRGRHEPLATGFRPRARSRWTRRSSSPTCRPGTSTRRRGGDIIGIFEDLRRQGRTVLVITHDPAFAKRARRIVEIRDGNVVRDARA